MLGTSNAFLNPQWHRCVWLVVPLSSQVITSRRWARYLAKSNSFKSFLHILRTCLWFTEQVTSPACLNSCFSDDPPPFFLTGVGRLLVCRSLSSSPLLAKPAGDLMHSLYWDHMNNLFFEFSPTLTFRCLMPTGFGFNNIDSAPFLCASSDKVWKHS